MSVGNWHAFMLRRVPNEATSFNNPSSAFLIDVGDIILRHSWTILSRVRAPGTRNGHYLPIRSVEYSCELTIPDQSKRRPVSETCRWRVLPFSNRSRRC